MKIEGYAAFHSLRPYRDINPNVWGLPVTVSALGEYGLGGLFVPRDAYDWDQGVAYGHPATVVDAPGSEQLRLAEDPIAVPFGPGGIEVVRSRIITPKEMQGRVPIVNDRATRALGYDVVKQASIFGDMMPTTVEIPPGTSITDEQLDRIPTPTIAIKPTGMRARNRTQLDVPKHEANHSLAVLRACLGDKGAHATFVAQAMARGVDVPGLRPLGVLPISFRPGENNELRMYGFVNTQPADYRLSAYATYQAAVGSVQEQSVQLNQTSEGLTDFFVTADVVARRLVEATDSTAILMAADFLKETPHGAVTLRGVKLRDPDFGLGGYAARGVLSLLLAKQLATAAGRAG